jgi:hypothetical protein
MSLCWTRTETLNPYYLPKEGVMLGPLMYLWCNQPAGSVKVAAGRFVCICYYYSVLSYTLFVIVYITPALSL